MRGMRGEMREEVTSYHFEPDSFTRKFRSFCLTTWSKGSHSRQTVRQKHKTHITCLLNPFVMHVSCTRSQFFFKRWWGRRRRFNYSSLSTEQMLMMMRKATYTTRHKMRDQSLVFCVLCPDSWNFIYPLHSRLLLTQDTNQDFHSLGRSVTSVMQDFLSLSLSLFLYLPTLLDQ